jgi:hypothetical protein
MPWKPKSSTSADVRGATSVPTNVPAATARNQESPRTPLLDGFPSGRQGMLTAG